MSAAVYAAVVLFPLLLPLWEQRPLVEADLRPGRYPYLVTREEVELQTEAFALGDPWFRGRVAVTLGECGDALAVPVLAGRLPQETDGPVRATILDQLGRLPLIDAKCEAVMRECLSDPCPAVRRSAVRAYARLPDSDTVELGRRATEDTDAGVRRAAWEELRTLAPKVGMPFFEKYRQASDPEVRGYAFSAACRKGQAAAAADAIMVGAGDSDPRVRGALAEALPLTPKPLALRLCGKLGTDPHPSVRRWTAAAVSGLEDVNLLPLLLTLASDTDGAVRLAAVTGMTRFPGQPAVTQAAKRLGDPSRRVRQAAEDALVQLHAGCPVTAVAAAALAERDVLARRHAARVLGRIQAREHANALAELLGREQEAENVVAVVLALGELEATGAGGAIAALAGHTDAEVRAAVAEALGRLGLPETYPALTTLISDAAPEVRRAAILAVGRTGDGRLSALPLQVLKSASTGTGVYTAEDRASACWAAGRLRPPQRELMDWLVTHATTPVIPVMGGRLFDADVILVSACLALVQCARADASARPQADKVLAAHGHKATAAEERTPPPNTLLPNAEIREGARQAQAWLAGRTPEPVPRPMEAVAWVYRRCQTPLP